MTTANHEWNEKEKPKQHIIHQRPKRLVNNTSETTSQYEMTKLIRTTPWYIGAVVVTCGAGAVVHDNQNARFGVTVLHGAVAQLRSEYRTMTDGVTDSA